MHYSCAGNWLHYSPSADQPKTQKRVHWSHHRFLPRPGCVPALTGDGLLGAWDPEHAVGCSRVELANWTDPFCGGRRPCALGPVFSAFAPPARLRCPWSLRVTTRGGFTFSYQKEVRAFSLSDEQQAAVRVGEWSGALAILTRRLAVPCSGHMAFNFAALNSGERTLAPEEGGR